MTIEIILLALASTIRPTSLAAVYALLSAAAPRRLMAVYVAAGLAFTILFGLVIVGVAGGISISSGSNRTKAIAQITGGVLALALFLLVFTGRLAVPGGDGARREAGGWTARLEGHLSLRTAALAGPATHIPGLFYLIALNVIVAHRPGVLLALFELALFNVVWFTLPIAALAISMVRPAAAQDVIGAVDGWVRSHARVIVLGCSLVVGVVLVVRGVLDL